MRLIVLLTTWEIGVTVAACCWAVAVLGKALQSRKSGRYALGVWDGGAFLKGKSVPWWGMLALSIGSLVVLVGLDARIINSRYREFQFTIPAGWQDMSPGKADSAFEEMPASPAKDAFRAARRSLSAFAVNPRVGSDGASMAVFSGEEIHRRTSPSPEFLGELATRLTASGAKFGAHSNVLESGAVRRNGQELGRLLIRVEGGSPVRFLVYSLHGTFHYALISCMAPEDDVVSCGQGFEAAVEAAILPVR